MSLTIATLAVPLFEESAELVATTVMAAGEGRMAGAVYRPSGEIVPRAGLPPGIPDTLQVTPVLEEFDTVAENDKVSPNKTEVLDGDTLTETGGGLAGGGWPTDEFDTVPEHPAKITLSTAPAVKEACRFCLRAK
jgi:hypothetical protein